MTLTVPRAGMTAGRSADIRVDTPQIGQDIQRLGETVQAVGNEVERRRLTTAASQLDVDMTRDLNNLRLEFEQIGDPDRIDAEWSGRVDALRKSYLQGYTENGRARVDPKLAERFNTQFDTLRDRHAFALGQKAVAQRQSQNAASWVEWRSTALSDGARMDLDSQDTLIDMGVRMLDERVARGEISAEDAAIQKQRLQSDMRETSAMQLVRDDPEMFLDLAEVGEFDALPPDQLERLKTGASGAIEKAAETAAKDRTKLIGGHLTRIGAVDDPSRLSTQDRAFLQSEEAQAHPDYAKTAAGVALADEQPGWRQLPLDELRAMEEEERARPVAYSWQEERLATIEAQIETHETGMRRDPVAYIAAQGFRVPDLPAFDPQDPGGFAAGLAARKAFSGEAGEAGWQTGGQLFTEEERAALKPQLSVSADPRERLSLADAMVRGLGSAAPAQARAITGGDPIFEGALRLLAEGAPQATAADMLSGARMLADGGVVIPAEGEFTNSFRRATDDMLADSPAFAAQLRATTEAIYAASTPVPGRRDDPKDFDRDLFDTAFQRALGASLGPNGEVVAGGLVEFDGNMLPLPIGLRPDRLSGALDAVREDLQLKQTGADFTTVQPPDLSRLVAASITGAAPDLMIDQTPDLQSNRNAARDLFSKYRLEPYWPDGQPRDDYLLVRERGGRLVALRDESGQPFRVSLQRLTRGVR